MSSPGWYPDPAGDPDLLRYWDGTGWGNQTRPVDRSAPTGPSAWPELEQEPAQAWASIEQGGRGRRTALIAAFAVALVVIAGGVVAGLTLTRHDSADPAPTPAHVPTSPGGGTTSAAPLVNDCPQADVDAQRKYAKDGSVHGGGLSFPRGAGFKAFNDNYGFAWLSDMHGETHPLNGDWTRLYVVGRLPAWPGYSSLKSGAESLLSCVARNDDMYPDSTDFKAVFSHATRVDGHDAWEARGKVYVDDAPYPGGNITVVTVDTGGDGYSAFMGDSPIGVKSDLAALDATVKRLRVD